MLAVTEPGVHIITAMVSTQLLKTALLENVFGYFAHLDPCPMLLLQPKEAAAEQFSKERITPMVRATPALRALVGTAKTRKADETLLFKSFPGGFLALAGAGSPDNLARRPIRVLLCDEVDKYPVTREGDPIALAEERTATFGVNWLSLRVCSPTVEDESRIAASYAESDQRRASVECPHCQHRQFLDFFKHVDWDKDVTPQGVTHQPETAQIYCEACRKPWSEGERLRALQTTRHHQTRPFKCCGELQYPLEAYDRAWRAVRDGSPVLDPVLQVWDWWAGPRWAVYRAKCQHCGSWAVSNKHAGFQAGKLFSPWQKDKPSDIATKWLAAQGNEDLLMSWWNTQAGLPYRANASKALVLEKLAERGERWAGEVPHGVAVITAGLDVQPDRVELELVGWGRNEESWSLAYEVFEGDANTDEVWNKVDAYLKRTFYRDDGKPFVIAAACIDTGGQNTQKVYEFCKSRLARKIWGIKGESAQNGQRNPVWPTKKPMSRTKASYRPVVIGVNAAKDVVRARLAIEDAGAGYMHVPADRDINWYAQLLAERLDVRESGGRKYRVWVPLPGRRNEALDCRVYAYAALCGLLHFGLGLNRRADEAEQPYQAAPEARRPIETSREETAPPPAAPPPRARPARRSRWAS
ncbi:phage terminase large subunit [Acetobacteraceae bacterium AT-5844]|nr:phage terminase large subunit [Acetobacteraceae bacterium AT-5844]